MTNTPSNNDSSRLDRIEANLETVSQALVRVSAVVENNRQDIDSNRSDIDAILDRLDQVSASIAASNQRTTQLEERFDRFVAQAEADRAIMLQILQYLRTQYPGNGRREG